MCERFDFGYEKAFHTVTHDILLNKLFTCGTRGFVYTWFKSYLLGSKQCVKVNGRFGWMGYTYYGVPQGSVLGAVLFIIYVTNLYG